MNVFRAPVLCLVTSRRALSPDARTVAEEVAALECVVDEALDAGIDLIQVREPDLAAAPLRSLVARLSARAAGGATRIVVNDRVDVAVVAHADGVHLRSDGPPPARVREICPSAFLVGRSIHYAREAQESGTAADYLLFGTVFASHSKPAGAPVAGVESLRAAAAATPAPILAIGGITPDRVRVCLDAGAAGVAGISVFLPEGRAPEALGVSRAVREFRAAMGRI